MLRKATHHFYGSLTPKLGHGMWPTLGEQALLRNIKHVHRSEKEKYLTKMVNTMRYGSWKPEPR